MSRINDISSNDIPQIKEQYADDIKEKVGKGGRLGKESAERKPSGRGKSRLFDEFLCFPLPDGCLFASRSNKPFKTVRLLTKITDQVDNINPKPNRLTANQSNPSKLTEKTSQIYQNPAKKSLPLSFIKKNHPSPKRFTSIFPTL